MTATQTLRLDDALAESLTDDGDTVEHDGRTFRLRISHDCDATVNDFDCYGRTERYSHGYRDRDTQRPDDMDGNAEKLDFHDGWIWWQPPARDAGPQRAEPAFGELRARVLEIVRWGFTVVFLEELGAADAYGRAVVVNYACIGAVEPFTRGADLAALVSDLASELESASA